MEAVNQLRRYYNNPIKRDHEKSKKDDLQFEWMFSFTEKGNMENEVGLREGQAH